ncbi:MAG: DNA-3-methyladenine glycosylase I [Anaeromyxobacter sp.]
MPRRCAWVPEGDELYARYHDEEWGVPLRDEQQLFELLCLEGAQAGLSWRTILHRREGYRAVFSAFDPAKLARLTDARLEKILLDPRIVRNRLKVFAVRENARAFLRLRKDGGLGALVWGVVDGTPRQNRRKAPGEVPAVTDEAQRLSKLLQQAGFRFVGPTICYAFMQAAGLVNDHLTTCHRHRAVQGQAFDSAAAPRRLRSGRTGRIRSA